MRFKARWERVKAWRTQPRPSRFKSPRIFWGRQKDRWYRLNWRTISRFQRARCWPRDIYRAALLKLPIAYRRAIGATLWIGANAAQRWIPRVGLWLAATMLYDLSEGTTFRLWVGMAYPDDTARQLACMARFLLKTDVPLFGCKLPATVARLLPDSIETEMRPINDTDSLATIEEPTIPVYVRVAVPLTSILKAAKQLKQL